MTRAEFEALPALSSFLPLVFPNGRRWHTFSGFCSRCNGPFSDAQVRGEVTHPFPRIFVLDAWGFCSACILLTPFRYRFTEDGGMTGRHPKTGEWVRWEPKRA